MAGIKKTNNYALDYPKYGSTPKAVVAAVAYSLAMRLCEDNQDEAAQMIRDEWAALYDAKIVPQKPVK